MAAANHINRHDTGPNANLCGTPWQECGELADINSVKQGERGYLNREVSVGDLVLKVSWSSQVCYINCRLILLPSAHQSLSYLTPVVLQVGDEDVTNMSCAEVSRLLRGELYRFVMQC